MNRLNDIRRFYGLLEELEQRLGGARTLRGDLTGVRWPARGIYFFFEPGEVRTTSGDGPRVVRVGTHAVSTASKSRLWGRLSQHRGAVKSGGGNHRGSIFRLIVGEALANSQLALTCPQWGKGGSAPAEVRAGEVALEQEVSRYIGAMPFLWLEADDEPSKVSIRAVLERNSIAMLSNFGREEDDVIDPASPSWLGRSSRREKVRASGLWNNHYVDDRAYNTNFLDLMEGLVRQVGRSR